MESSSPADHPKHMHYQEPELLFTSVTMAIGISARDEVTVTQLVRKDQPLLEFPQNCESADGSLPRQPLALGANCYYSADQNRVFAAVTGYPKIVLTSIADNETILLHISIEPLFRISSDAMKTSIAIHPPVADCRCLADYELQDLLTEAGIVHGLDQDAINSAKKIINARLPEFNILPVAAGTRPVNGLDAYLKFEVETGPIPGKLLEDGSIDFRERMIFVPVTKDQVIARKIPPTRGTPGKNVLGQRVEPVSGRDIRVNTLKDASYSSKTRKVTATNDGVLSIVGDTIIKICSRQEIIGDINYATGHIHSRNSVLIHGSVQPGFRVTTDGDLEIKGTVMSTRISSRANIVIKSGILGKSSAITALGDVDLYFVEQGEVECGRNCIIRRESYYSTVIAGRNILCMPHSGVIGGRLIAAGNIIVGSIGSANSAPALLAAGVDGRRFLQYNELQKSLVEQQEALVKFLQMHKGAAQSRRRTQLEKEIEATRQQLLHLNLIPGTGRLSRPEDGDETAPGGSVTIQDVAIEIHGVVHAGTVIQIGHRSITLTNTIANRSFRLNDTFTDIAASPLRRR